MIGYDGYGLRSGLARKYRIGLNIVRTGEIGVKGLFLEYGEYSAKYSPTKILKIKNLFCCYNKRNFRIN